MVKVIVNGVRKQVIRRNNRGKFPERSDTQLSSKSVLQKTQYCGLYCREYFGGDKTRACGRNSDAKQG